MSECTLNYFANACVLPGSKPSSGAKCSPSLYPSKLLMLTGISLLPALKKKKEQGSQWVHGTAACLLIPSLLFPNTEDQETFSIHL